MAKLRGFLLLTLVSLCGGITFPCIAPLLGPTIPSAPSREPSPARSRTPDESDGNGPLFNRLTIRGGDLQVSRSPRARSESGVDSEENALFDAIGKLKLSSAVSQLQVKVVARFRVNYSTKWGENVVILGSTEELGGFPHPSEIEARAAIAAGKGKVMRYVADGNWEFMTVLDAAPSEITYRYALVRERGEPLVEGGARSGRRLAIDSIVNKGLVDTKGSDHFDVSTLGLVQLEIRDQWRVSRPNGEDVIFQTDAMRLVFGQERYANEDHETCGRAKEIVPVQADALPGKQTQSTLFRLTIERTRVPLGSAMAVECEALFGSKPAMMSCKDFPTWELEVKVPQDRLPVQYRYVVVNSTTIEVQDRRVTECIRREAGAVRWLGPALGNAQQPAQQAGEAFESYYAVEVRDEASTDRWPQESRVPLRTAGIKVALTSLPSHRGMGVGCILDLKQLVDFCARSHLKILHLDSISDTTGYESNKREPLCAHAVHPMYMSVRALVGLREGALAEKIGACEKTMLNASLDEVMSTKMSLLRKVYDLTGQATVESDGFASFVQDNGYWVKPYALFCALREEYGTSDTSQCLTVAHGTQWEEYTRLTPAKIDLLSCPGGAKYIGCCYWYWLQYHLHLQLSEVSTYAREKGVALVGDVRFSSSFGGVDFWARPELFRSDKQMGSPPDASSPTGYSWGVPAYDWDRLGRDGGGWWHGRIWSMSQYMQGAHLSHAQGFFKHWELPRNAITGLGGRQVPSVPIAKEELDTAGLWDRRRLCEPYIRKHLLERRLGADWSKAADRFLEGNDDGVYKFKAGLDNELALMKSIKATPLELKGVDEDRALTEMFHILHDRCLIRDEKAPDDKFYPRAMMWMTDSFAELGQDWQRRLREMHDTHFTWKQDGLFETTGRDRLALIQRASSMLITADDVGPVHALVPKVLSEMAIPGLRLHSTTPPESMQHLSCASTSGAGVSLQQWWGSLDPVQKAQSWTNMGCSGDAPTDAAGGVARTVISNVMKSQALIAVIPLQDMMLLAPSNKTHIQTADRAPASEWRCALTVDDLTSKDSLLPALIASQLQESLRCSSSPA